MSVLQKAYECFLVESGASDESGRPRVQMGAGVEAPPAAAIGSLVGTLRRGLGRNRWVLRIEVGLIVILTMTLLALVAVQRNGSVPAAGVSAAGIMGVLRHLRGIWRETTEIELVIGMADNLPPADVLRFIEMRLAQRRN